MDEGGTRVVLEAAVPEAMLLLFIDGDQLSHLELAPIDPDVAVAEFPPAESLSPGARE